MICPCCGGSGEIKDLGPVKLTTTQQRIYDIVKSAKNGIGCTEIVDRLYADRRDGGPDTAINTVNVIINQMNKRLAAVNQRIKCDHRGRGATFNLYQL